ncbi:MAG: hypothetical protein JW704_00665 [Anaerolineaceae bacterium]|nr:hypothetical protein [Anaerolineaceae bacterium]
MPQFAIAAEMERNGMGFPANITIVKIRWAIMDHMLTMAGYANVIEEEEQKWRKWGNRFHRRKNATHTEVTVRFIGDDFEFIKIRTQEGPFLREWPEPVDAEDMG